MPAAAHLAIEAEQLMFLQVPALEQQLLLALLPKDEADERGVVLEVGQALSDTLHGLCAPSGRGLATCGRLRQGPARRPSTIRGIQGQAWALLLPLSALLLHSETWHHIKAAPQPRLRGPLSTHAKDATLDVHEASNGYCTPLHNLHERWHLATLCCLVLMLLPAPNSICFAESACCKQQHAGQNHEEGAACCTADLRNAHA